MDLLAIIVVVILLLCVETRKEEERQQIVLSDQSHGTKKTIWHSILRDSDKLFVVGRPPVLHGYEIRKAVSEHRGKRFVYEKIKDVQEHLIQRYQVKTTYERTTTTTIAKPYKSEISKETNMNIIKGKRETKINDAYTETIENFPDAFLALCTGQQLSERRATSGYLSPLSHDECQNLKIVQASLDFLTSHQKHERSNCLLVEQKDRICVLPVCKVTYIRKKKTKYLWIVGTNRKVYDPFYKPSNCCICC